MNACANVSIAVVWAVALFGCSPAAPSRPADAPGPSPARDAVVWGMVVDRSGLCIEGAAVHVIDGQLAGRSETQRTPCDVWAYDGGFMFRNLIAGEPMTLRLSADGYEPVETTVRPTGTPFSVSAFALTPR